MARTSPGLTQRQSEIAAATQALVDYIEYVQKEIVACCEHVDDAHRQSQRFCVGCAAMDNDNVHHEQHSPRIPASFEAWYADYAA